MVFAKRTFVTLGVNRGNSLPVCVDVARSVIDLSRVDLLHRGTQNHHSLRPPISRIDRSRHRSLTVDRMASLEATKAAWRTADAVTFDVDSTVIQEEGIDELANFCGKGDQVAQLTKQAMQGNMTFQQSLAVRLNIIRPSLQQVKEFITTHPPKLTPGIKELISALQAKKKEVFLVSGGFRCLIGPVASQLNIPPENVYANRLKFYFTGEFAGFDDSEPTSRSGGKSETLRILKEKHGFGSIVHVGDGATDLEACPPADAFIGYGGNVVRDAVKSRALWFVTDFKELQDEL